MRSSTPGLGVVSQQPRLLLNPSKRDDDASERQSGGVRCYLESVAGIRQAGAEVAGGDQADAIARTIRQNFLNAADRLLISNRLTLIVDPAAWLGFCPLGNGIAIALWLD